MRPSLDIRSGRSEDANRLAVLATQVWLHTYATSGITADIAEYVLLELTPAKYRALLNDPTCQVFVAVSGESLVGLAVVKFGTPCPAGNASSAELQTLYVQEHFLGCGSESRCFEPQKLKQSSDQTACCGLQSMRRTPEPSLSMHIRATPRSAPPTSSWARGVMKTTCSLAPTHNRVGASC